MSSTVDANSELKQTVKAHWEKKICGAAYGRDSATGEVDLDRMAAERYQLEPYIQPFADFPSGRGQRLLEIGVGGGTDFSQWIRHGARATGIDLTEAGVGMTRRRLEQSGFSPDQYDLLVGDAENLPFAENSFEVIYSYGVLHHSPDTPRALQEACRVLRAGGTFKAMIYHLRSWVSWMFWLRYSLLMCRPFQSARRAVFRHLESPGTKTYLQREAHEMTLAAGFREVRVFPQLSFGDLLLNLPGKRFRSRLYRLIWKLYPRWFIRLFGDRFGNILFIVARK